MPDAKSPVCLESALTSLYTTAHKATFRLLVDAVIARRHLRQVYKSSWPSFVLTGQTKSGKSLLTIGACRLFGLDDGLLAENVAASFSKGDRIMVQGNAELEHWVDRDGKERTSKRILANYVGPDLRFATVEIHRVTRRSPSKAADRDEGGYPDADEPF